jgi:hypothetical protein
MHLPLGGGSRALFIVAEYAVWLGCVPWRLGAVSLRPPRTADRLRSC